LIFMRVVTKNIIVDFGNIVNNKLAKKERLLYTDIVRFYE